MNTDVQKAAISVAEFCKAVGIGRSFFYEQLKGGHIRVVKAGRRTLVPASELTGWLARLPSAGEA
jgi:excisionase family DNA binding protein